MDNNTCFAILLVVCGAIVITSMITKAWVTRPPRCNHDQLRREIAADVARVALDAYGQGREDEDNGTPNRTQTIYIP